MDVVLDCLGDDQYADEEVEMADMLDTVEEMSSSPKRAHRRAPIPRGQGGHGHDLKASQKARIPFPSHP
jgi:hypothetical protein